MVSPQTKPTIVMHLDPIATGNRKLLWAMTIGLEIVDAVLCDPDAMSDQGDDAGSGGGHV